jgi:TatD DNase family protein
LVTTWLTDAHIHLSDDEFKPDLQSILTAMNKMSMKACCVSVDYQSSQATLDLGKKSPLILPFLGLHPEKAKGELEPVVDLIEENSNQISGIGEIGLDKTYISDKDGFNRQVQVFQKMLSLAEKMRKPISVHSRRTLDEIFSVFPSYSLSGILLHWFAGSKQQLKKAMDLGCFVSYGPATVYSQDKQILLSQTDNDKVLFETDGPVKFSRCFGFKTAQITFLPSVLFCAANILGITYDEMLTIAETNTNSYLGV